LVRPPDDALSWARQRYAKQKRRWLDDAGQWPLELSLERPSEHLALKQPAAVRQWSQAWADWDAARTRRFAGSGVRLHTDTLAWQRLGSQTLPDRISFSSASDVANFVGEGASWGRAVARRQALVQRWAQLSEAGLGTHFETLSTWTDHDFDRLVSLLEWFDLNPRSGLFLRQLPIAGIDTKWIDLHRRGVVADMLRRLRRGVPLGEDDPADTSRAAATFFELCGLRKPSARIRILLLSPRLRLASGGLRDIEAPLEQLQQLNINPRHALIVENQETAHCLPDLDDSVALVKLGSAVSLAAELPWLRGVPVAYWGDTDTHGFAILTQARKALGNVTSLLMDEATLLQEPSQHRSANDGYLTPEESSVYKGLLEGRWGERLRLEQERIEWKEAIQAVERAFGLIPQV
jgi:hypothetical protein